MLCCPPRPGQKYRKIRPFFFFFFFYFFLNCFCYVFKKYLEHYPDSNYTDRVSNLLESIQNSLPYPIEITSLEELLGESLHIDVGSHTQASMLNNSTANPSSSLSNAPTIDIEEEKDELKNKYYEGMNAFSQKDIPRAIQIFEEIVNSKKYSASDSFFCLAQFELGRVYSKNNQFKESIIVLSNYIKKQPTQLNSKKALFIMGNIFQSQKNIEKAINCYSKVEKFLPFDKDSKTAKELIQKLKK